MRLLATTPQLHSIDATLGAGAICAAGSAVVDRLTGWSCPVYAATSWWCPFCGGSRSVESLANGHLDSALRDNGLVVLVLVFIAVRLVLRFGGGQVILGRLDWWIGRVNLRVWAIALIAWIVIRNLSELALLGPPATQ